jgi:hypothetical protein
MRLPVQSPPIQRDLLMSGSHRDRVGIQPAQGGIFGPFGPFGPGSGGGGPGGPFGLFAPQLPQPPHITYEINTWLQAVPLDSGSAGCSRVMTAHAQRVG